MKIPSNLKPELAAPILCAGVTTYSPLRHWGVKKGDKVGIIGFGGLGDIAAKLAIAMGAQVILFTSSEQKTTEAARLGAAVVLNEDLEEEETLRAHKASLDFMLSTIPEKTDLNPFIPFLKRNASLVVVGALEPLSSMNNMEIAGHRRSVGGSLIGSIAETQEVLDFCAEHNIGPDIQIIDMKDINDAYDKVENKEVRFRYVIDISSLKNSLAV